MSDIFTYYLPFQLLIGAIRRNYVEEHYCQFASQLLLMTLGFLTRIIKSQVLLEEQVDTDALVKRTEDEELGMFDVV